MPQGKLVLITGPSGTGKGALIDRVLKAFAQCTLAVSATTRAPRPGEVEGRNYYFLSRDEFRSRITSGDFIEHAEYAGNYYGTPKTEIEALMAAGTTVLVELEVQGALQLMAKPDLKPVSIFILPPPPMIETLRRRLIRRGTESPERIEARLKIAVGEINQASKFQYRVVNDSLEQGQRELTEIIGSKMGLAVTR